MTRVPMAIYRIERERLVTLTASQTSRQVLSQQRVTTYSSRIQPSHSNLALGSTLTIDDQQNLTWVV
jgi:hypothetical protein